MKLSDDDFALFGLPRRHELDRAELDARWRALQSEAHPDRFAAEGAAAQRVAMQWAVRINEAYRRLRDPLSRAAYLCELAGASIDAERNTTMPADFLVQQMQWREALDEARSATDIEAIDVAVLRRERELLAEAAQLLDEAKQAPAAAIKVRELMFVARFRQDIDRRLAALESNA
jgi:molecular chaperone HscB